MRMRKKPNLAARTEKCAALIITGPKDIYGQTAELTAGYRALHLELGCGKGRFTVETAKENPDVFYIALEKSQNAMIIALERAFAAGLSNVRFISALADDITEFFAPGEVSRIYLNFCDPWPANRHAKRRLTSAGFLERYKKILPPGGQIHFKTDNLPLFEFSLEQLRRCGFTLSEVTRNLHENGVCGIMTDYEMKFHALGVPINRCVAAREPNELCGGDGD